MKRKYYFILSSLTEIITALYSIVIADKLLKKLMAATTAFPLEMQDRINKMYANTGSTFIIALAILCIILNALIMYYAFSNNLVKKKGLIIAFSIITFFTANIELIEIVSVLNIIILAFTKRVNPEDFPIKKEIPKLHMEKVDKKKRIGSALLLIFYFSQFIWEKFIPKGYNLPISIIFYLLMIIFSIWCFRDTLKRDFDKFRHDLGAYLRFIFPRMGIFYLIYFIVSLIAITVAGGIANNQSNLEELPILVSLPLAILYAPIVEECLFRGSIRRFIKNEKLFIILSGVIFGLLHTITTETSIFRMIILALPYGIMGSYLAYIYAKTNNMCSNIFSHFFNNAIAMIISILITGI